MRTPYYKYILWLFLFAFATQVNVSATTFMPDDEDQYDESIRKPVRRLYPNRQLDKERAKLLQEQERLAKQNQQPAEADDPWGEAPSPDKAELYKLLNKDYTSNVKVPEFRQAEPYKWVDETPRADESSLMQVVGRQSLSQSDGQRYAPRSAKSSNAVNDIYFYFDELNKPQQLMLRVQYYADDPLNFHEVKFLVDGFEYVYIPPRTSKGKGTGRMIWEDSDNPLTKKDKDLVYALTHCQWVMMSLVGDGGMKHVKLLSDTQLENLRSVLQLFLLHGGRI